MPDPAQPFMIGSSLVPVPLGIWQLWMLVSIAMLLKLVIDDTMVLLPICCQDRQQYAGSHTFELHLTLNRIAVAWHDPR